MTLQEYLKVKNFTYKEYLAYLKQKYGKVLYRYGNKKNHKRGLFIHHDKENEIPSLSHTDNRKAFPEYQAPEFLTYCDYLEHLLLHIMIGRETAITKNLGLDGPCFYIIPAIISYYKYGYKKADWDDEYYEALDGNEKVFDLLLEEYNELTALIDILVIKNEPLYLEVEKNLDTKGCACAVLGTGLGKSSIPQRYINSHNISKKILIVGPNNLIKNDWQDRLPNEDVKTYQGLASDIENNKLVFSDYGLAILDEAHHIGHDLDSGKGALVWGTAAQKLFDAGIKVLGLTATQKRTDGIILSETIFKDCTVIGRTIPDALEDESIWHFDYITAIYDTDGITEDLKDLGYASKTEDPEYNKLRGQLDIELNNTPTAVEILRKHMKPGKRKGIIYCRDIEVVPEAIQLVKTAFPEMADKIKPLHSDLDNKTIEETRQWFKDTDEGYVAAIDMISEGAHYKVNTIIMFRRTEANSVFEQQLGRAILLKTNDKDPGIVVFDLVNNINNIKDRQRNKNLQPSLDKNIIKALRKLQEKKSEQIIIQDYCQDIVKRLRQLQAYTCRQFDAWEDEVINNYFEDEGGRGCVKRINTMWKKLHPDAVGSQHRTQEVVEARAHFLGKYKKPAWSAEQDELIKTWYPIEGRKMAWRIPEKTIGNICKHATEDLHLVAPGRGTVWTPEQDRVFLENYSKMSLDDFCKFFPEQSKQSIKSHAQILGVVKNRSRQIICIETGKVFETFKDLEAEMGYTVKSVCPAIKSHGLVDNKYHFAYVDEYNENWQPKVKQKRKSAHLIMCVETGEISYYLNELALKYKVNKTRILSCCRNPTHTAGGYHWKYAEN